MTVRPEETQEECPLCGRMLDYPKIQPPRTAGQRVRIPHTKIDLTPLAEMRVPLDPRNDHVFCSVIYRAEPDSSGVLYWHIEQEA